MTLKSRQSQEKKRREKQQRRRTKGKEGKNRPHVTPSGGSERWRGRSQNQPTNQRDKRKDVSEQASQIDVDAGGEEKNVKGKATSAQGLPTWDHERRKKVAFKAQNQKFDEKKTGSRQEKPATWVWGVVTSPKKKKQTKGGRGRPKSCYFWAKKVGNQGGAIFQKRRQ